MPIYRPLEDINLFKFLAKIRNIKLMKDTGVLIEN